MVKQRKYKMENALAELNSRIHSGNIKQGTFLPSERKLAELLDISRGTLRSVLKKLQQQGIIRINPGKGAYVVDSLSRKGLRRFAVICSTISSCQKPSEGMGMLLGVCSAASKVHAEALISFEGDSFEAEDIISRFNTDDIQGVVLFECANADNVIKPLEAAGVPFVIANPEHEISAVSARINYRQVGRYAGQLLLQAGHRKIGLVTGPLQDERIIYREMLAGFRGALAEEELTLQKNWIIETLSEAEDARIKVSKLLSENSLPTAFFAMRDVRACGLYTACRELNIKIPDEISVLSYDDITWESAQQAGLSTLKEPIEQLGESAVTLLAEWVETGIPPRCKEFSAEFIHRASIKNI
ncbi:GntR family transcriptional regulator [Lentisphaerota bacterium ZTH]|nr:GntR family transcriptional regulator [Lentisphaerota bacterium]WET05737.1 GntR family transcriptional regulator [Lentisphaerota bacterium ZTH]